ncbi:hypothetical protein AY606_06280 [Acinetobacter sp. SFB]|uniref:hypothetical protein n=1 Tax=Acinetobacter sp. SFB TaxID=1805634 RepID=UPI0007D80C39|nr:hypothetical protein [Acinetobacter sp. SFB]OAL79032.1 hypothetical protein AY606_06280 [Acinetobacter sp. SFB]
MVYAYSDTAQDLYAFCNLFTGFFPRKCKQTPQEYLQVLDIIQQCKNELQKRSKGIFIHSSGMPQTTPADIQCLSNT